MNAALLATVATLLITGIIAAYCGYIQLILNREWSFVATMIVALLPPICLVWLAVFIKLQEVSL